MEIENKTTPAVTGVAEKSLMDYASFLVGISCLEWETLKMAIDDHLAIKLDKSRFEARSETLVSFEGLEKSIKRSRAETTFRPPRVESTLRRFPHTVSSL